MNTRYSHIGLAIWMLIGIPLGFSESFDPHPAVTGGEATVTLGMECAHAVYERCLATQYATNPPAYRVEPPNYALTNTNGWYLDQAMMTILDTKIKALVPCYIDTNALPTNMTMLTMAGVLASLDIGVGSNFTKDSSVITNVFWNAADLTERYKVLSALQYTTASVTRTYAERWEGEATITTNAHTPLINGFALAYAAAVSNYAYVTNGYLSDGVWINDSSLLATDIKQWAWNREWVTTNVIATNYVWQKNLNVTITNNWVWDLTNVWPSGDTNRFTIGTNALVTNCVRDNVSGLVWLRNANVGYMNWADASNYLVTINNPDAPAYGYTNWRIATESEWLSFVDTNFTYPALSDTIGVEKWSEGDAFVGVPTGANEYYWAADWPPEEEYAWVMRIYMGAFVDKWWGTIDYGRMWPMCNGGDVPIKVSTLNPSGTYAPVTNCNVWVGSNEYTTWSNSTGWLAILNTNGASPLYFLATNPLAGQVTWTCSWEKADNIVTGEYVVSHSFINLTNVEGIATGKVAVVSGDSYICGTNYEHWTNVHYRTELLKVGISNRFVSATNMAHKAGYFAYLLRPVLGDSNYFNHQGLSLTESNWNGFCSNNWSFLPLNFAWVIGAMSNAPIAAPEIGTNAVDLDIYSGFEVVPPIRAVTEWQFQYCTNKFW